jgi:hypothetical protein
MATVVSMIETETVLQVGEKEGIDFHLELCRNETRSSEVLSTVDAQV